MKSNIPRIVIATLGMDQHENGAIAVQRMLAESQMVVSYMGILNTPAQVADHAEEVEADVIGISCHSWEYLTLVPLLVEELKRRQLDIDVIIGGSVITSEDARKMEDAGVAAVFTSATDNFDMVECVRRLSATRSNLS